MAPWVLCAQLLLSRILQLLRSPSLLRVLVQVLARRLAALPVSTLRGWPLQWLTAIRQQMQPVLWRQLNCLLSSVQQARLWSFQ